MSSEHETPAPFVDLAESIGLLVLPALGMGVVLGVLSGTENIVAGVTIGGLFGAIMMGLRQGFVAIRTSDGIERKRRLAPEDTVWSRIAQIEYDSTYDRAVSLVLFAVGVTALAAIPVVGPQSGPLVLRLVTVGLFGLVASLLLFGLSSK